SDTWTSLAAVPKSFGITTEGSRFAALGADGNIYVFASRFLSEHDFDEHVAVYRPSSDTWDSLSTGLVHRMNYGVVSGVDGRLYILGGDDGGDNEPSTDHYVNTFFDAVEAYAVGSGAWALVAPMPAVLYY